MLRKSSHASSKTRKKLMEANELARRSWGGSASPQEALDLQVMGVNRAGEMKRRELQRRLSEKRTSLDELEKAKHELLDESMRSMQHMLAELDKVRAHGASMREGIDKAKLELERASHLKDFCLRNNEMLKSETLEMHVLQKQDNLSLSQTLLRYLPQDSDVCAECRNWKRSLEYCRIESGHTDQIMDESEIQRIVYLSQRYRDLLTTRTSLFKRSKASIADGLLENFSLKLQKLEDFGMFQNQDWMDEISKKNNHAHHGFYGKSSTKQPTLDRVYSYSGKGLLGNVRCIPRKRLFFTCGSLFVIQDLNQSQQRCFSLHDDLITTFSGYPRENPSTMASGQSGDGKVFIWDIESLQAVAELCSSRSEKKKDHAVMELRLSKGVRALSFNKQGDQLAVLGDDDDQTLVVFACKLRNNQRPWSECECIAQSSASTQKVLVCEFDTYSPRLVTCGVNNVGIWSMRGGRLERDNVSSGHEVTDETHMCVGFVQEEVMLTGTSSGLLFVWRGSRLHQVISNAHTGPVLCICCESLKVTSGGFDQKVCLWNFDPLFRIANPGKLGDGEMLVDEIFLPEVSGFSQHKEKFGAHKEKSDTLGANLSIGCICSISWNVNQLYCGTWNNHIVVLDVAKKTVEFYIAGHHGEEVSGLALDVKTRIVASAGFDGVILMHDTTEGRPVCALNLNLPSLKADRNVKKNSRITCLDMYHSGYVAVATDDGAIFVWKLLREKTSAPRLEQHLMSRLLLRRDMPTAIRFSPTATRMAVGMKSGCVQVYDFDDLVQQTIDPVVCVGLKQAVSHIDWNFESSTIRCTDIYNNLRMFNAYNGNEIYNRKLKFRVTLKRMRERGKSSLSPLAMRLTDSFPYHVISVDRLFDVKGRRSDEVEYGNSQISVGDELASVNGKEVQLLRPAEVKDLLYGDVCHKECSHECSHSNVAIELMRSVELESTPGTGTQEAGSEKEGKRIEWSSLSCPLSWECSVLFLHDSEASVLRSVTYLSDQETVIAGNLYGSIHVLTRHAADAEDQEAPDAQQSIHCSVDFIASHSQRDTFLTACRTFELILQWRLTAVDRKKEMQEKDRQLLPSQDEFESWYGPSAEDIGQVVWKRKREDSMQRQLIWMQNSVPPVKQQARRVRSEYEMHIEQVRGQSRRTRRRSFAVVGSGEIVYALGIFCVLENFLQKSKQRIFVGHNSTVTTLAVHPKKRLVASGDVGPRPKVCIWDSESWEWTDNVLSSELIALSGFFTSPISALEFSRDGKLLLIAEETSQGSLLIFDWELQPQSPLARTSIPLAPVLVAAHIPNTDLFVLCSHQGNQLLQVGTINDQDASASCSLLLQPPSVSDSHHAWELFETSSPGTEGNVQEATAALLAAGQTWMEAVESEWWVSGSVRGDLLLWHKQELVQSVRAHEASLLAVTSNFEFCNDYFPPSADRKATKGSEGVRTGERLTWRKAQEYRDLDVQADRDLIVTVGTDGTLRVWKLSDAFIAGSRRFNIDELYARLKFLSKSMKSRLILISTIDLWIKTIEALDVFEMLSKSQMISSHEWYPILEKNKKLAETYTEFLSFMQNIQQVCAAKFQSTASELIQRIFSLETRIRDMKSADSKDKLQILTFQNEVLRLKQLLEEQNFVIQKSVALVQEFKIGQHRADQTLSPDLAHARYLTFTSPSDLLLGYRDMSIFHLDLKQGGWTKIHDGMAGDVAEVRASRDGQEFVMAANSLLVDFWHVGDNRKRREQVDRVICAVDVGPSFIVCGSQDGAVLLLLDGKERTVVTVQLGSEKISKIRLNPANNQLAAAVANDIVICHLGKLSAGEEGEIDKSEIPIAGRLSGHSSKVSDLDWSTDGEFLRSVSLEAAELILWDVFKCRRVSPHLTEHVDWASSRCLYSWQMIPGHEHTWLEEKRVNRHVLPLQGMQVTPHRVEDSNSSVVGSVRRVTGENVCLVQWHNHPAKSFWQLEKSVEKEDPHESLLLLDNTQENFMTVTDSWLDKQEGIQLVGCGDRNGCLLLFDSSQHAFPRPLLQLQVHAGPVSQLSFSKDGSRVLTYGASDGCLTSWRCERKKPRVSLTDFLLDCSTGSSVHFFKRLKELPPLLFPSDTAGGREQVKLVLKIIEQMRSGIKGDSDVSIGIILSLDEEIGIELFRKRKQSKVIETIVNELSLLFDIPDRRIEFYSIDRKVCTIVNFNLLPRFTKSESSTQKCFSLLLQEIVNPWVLKKHPGRFPYLKHVILANKVEVFARTNKELQEKLEDQEKKSANLLARLRRFEQRFRVFHSKIFMDIKPSKLVHSKDLRPRFKFTETIMTKGELELLFNMLDYGNRKVIRVDDLLKAIRNNPDLANVLNVASDRSQDRILSRIRATLPEGTKELLNWELDVQTFVRVFKDDKTLNKASEGVKSIEPEQWSIRSRIVQPPPLHLTCLVISRPWQEMLDSSRSPSQLSEEQTHRVSSFLSDRGVDLTPHESSQQSKGSLSELEFGRHLKQFAPIKTSLDLFQVLDKNHQGFISFSTLCDALQTDDNALKMGIYIFEAFSFFRGRLYRYLFEEEEEETSMRRPIPFDLFLEKFSGTTRDKLMVSVPFRPPMKPVKMPPSLVLQIFEEVLGGLGTSIKLEDLFSYIKSNRTCSDALGLTDWLRQGDARERIAEHIFGSRSELQGREVRLEDFLLAFAHVSKDQLGVARPYHMNRGGERLPQVSLSTAIQVFESCSEKPTQSISYGQLVESLERFPALVEKLQLGEVMREDDRAAVIFRSMFGSKELDSRKSISFDDFIRIFSSKEKDVLGLTTGFKRKRRRTHKTMMPLEEAAKCFEELDERKRGTITHGELIAQLYQKPQLAKTLGLANKISFMSRERFSIFVFSIFNPGKGDMSEAYKYSSRHFIKTLSGSDLSGQSHALGNWRKLFRSQLDRPRWTQLVTRLLMFNLSLFSVKGIHRIRDAAVQAAELAVRFLDAIDSPRALLHKGDGQRIAAVLAQVVYIANFNGPVRESQLDLAVSRVTRLFESLRSKGLPEAEH